MLNKVTLMGRLTKDPEVRTTQNSKQVASFTIAVDRKKGKAAKVAGEKTADFFNIVAWEGLAGIIANYCKKGKNIIISGRLSTRDWTDDKGTKHYVTEILADDIIFADSNKTEGGTTTTQVNTTQRVDDQGFYPIADDDELPF